MNFSTIIRSLVVGSVALSATTLFAEVKVPLTQFSPLPDQVRLPDDSPEKVALGEKLYHEKRLSKNQDLSCNSCHDLKRFGVDNEPTSPGTDGARGERNSPTVLNATLHIAQFWDGRAASLEEQALGPVMNPVEMAMSTEEEVVKRLKDDKEYGRLFSKSFPGETDPVSFVNMGKAIAAFERTLITPSRFDSYLKGEAAALNDQEQKGLQLFVESGCSACHSGVGLGGHMFQKLGLVKPFPTKDVGRFAVTNVETDKQVFKVPSLRNVAKTGPYFHDGSVKTLDEAVRLMGSHQLGKDFSSDQVKDLVAFLGSLTGTLE